MLLDRYPVSSRRRCVVMQSSNILLQTSFSLSMTEHFPTKAHTHIAEICLLLPSRPQWKNKKTYTDRYTHARTSTRTHAHTHTQKLSMACSAQTETGPLLQQIPRGHVLRHTTHGSNCLHKLWFTSRLLQLLDCSVHEHHNRQLFYRNLQLKKEK